MIHRKKGLYSIVGHLALTCLALLFTANARPDEWHKVATVYLKEYMSPSRSGTLTVYYNSTVNATSAYMSVDPICVGDTIRMAGGVANGWVSEIGAVDANLLDLLSGVGLRSTYTWVSPEDMQWLSNLVYYNWPNMGPRSYTFGFAVDYGAELEDGSYGENHHCGGAVVDEAGFFAVLLQYPFPYGRDGDWIGDFVVYGEATGGYQEWYGVYLRP